VSGRVFLVRHGRTTLNAEGRFRGRLDPPLDDVGYLDAARAAHQLKDIGLVAVYTSPLRRAAQTAEFVASAANVRRIVEPDLIDLDHGAWQGLTAEEAREHDPEEFDRFRRSPESSTPPGGEALKHVERRTAEALRRLSLLHESAPIAAVSHEIPIRLVLCRAAPLPPPRTMWDLELPTGSVTELLVLESDLRLASQDAARLHEQPGSQQASGGSRAPNSGGIVRRASQPRPGTRSIHSPDGHSLA
jgi:broad specificity phosphatase PhoE